MTFELSSDTAYTLTNMVTGKAADLNTSNEKEVTAQELHGGLNQQWYFEDAGSTGSVYIRSAWGSRLYITYQGGSPVQGAPLMCGESKYAWQVFRASPPFGNPWRITIANGYFGVDNLSHLPSAISLWETNTSPYQQWTIKPVSV
ncbi:hypothetical protein DL93DRAFT_2212016 [Clavulina sp. PMI_390]|nr:hypothetical protein DL93DRAFT_2212016 [Clavulina sp. PMI_390]